MIPDQARELEGMCPDDMRHVSEISSYNSNYYIANGRLLYAHSDDDNTTDWWLILRGKGYAIGVSYEFDGDRIILGDGFT